MFPGGKLPISGFRHNLRVLTPVPQPLHPADLLAIVERLKAIAQFEREIMLQRQREGIAAAKAKGKYKGRAPTVRRQAAEIARLHGEGVSKAEIARRLGVHRANVGRVLAAS
jgi:DNA invertase Pin-like site-specific DNA recombinase